MSECVCRGESKGCTRVRLDGRDISALCPVACSPADGWVRVLRVRADAALKSGRRLAHRLRGRVEVVDPAPEESPAPEEPPAPEERSVRFRWRSDD